jgi:hypothetical protein
MCTYSNRRQRWRRKRLLRVYYECPRRDIKLIIGDMNANVRREDECKPAIGNHNFHDESNNNEVRLINFVSVNNR